MKKIVFLIFVIVLLLFSTKGVWASEDIVMTLNSNNLHLIWSGSEQDEMLCKLGIFFDLAKELLNKKGIKSQVQILCTNFPRDENDTLLYAVGYGTFKYSTKEDHPFDMTNECEGIILHIWDENFNAKQWLEFLNTCLENETIIKGNSAKNVIQCWGWKDTIYKVPYTLMETFLGKEDNTITELLKEKRYRNFKWHHNFSHDYYFQNNSFHFISSRDTAWINSVYNYRNETNIPDHDTVEIWSKDDKQLLEVKWGDDVFDAPDVHQIVKDINSYDGKFIFINDSIFYYVDRFDSRFRGPYIIHGLPKRDLVARVESSQYPEPHFLLRYYNGEPYRSRILFVPDQGKIVEDYDIKFKAFFKAVQQNSHKEPAKGERKDDTPFLTYVEFLIAVLVSCFFFIRRR